MDTIVEEKSITFKELEQKIFKYVCDIGIEITQKLLENKDKEIHESRNKSKYRDKGFRATSIKTIYGDVTYSRHVYKTVNEDGRREYIYLLDEYLNMDKIGLISTNLAEKIADCITEESYRAAADVISNTSGQTISHGGIWKVVQRLGERVTEEEAHMVKELQADTIQAEKEIDVLFEEMDGVWLKFQGKDHKKMPKQEMKVATIYEGWKSDRTRSSLVGKKVIAGMEKSEEFHKKREAQIRSIYNADEIKYRILNGDGGGWIKDPYDPEVIYQLDPFHIKKAIKDKINQSEEARTDITALYEDGKIDYMLDYIEMYANSVDTGKEGDKRAEKAWELYKYLTDNKDGLLPYDKRNLNLPQPPEGVCYKKMGVQENQNCTVITMRMKGKRRRWSISGANNMAKLLYKKENKELHGVVERYAEELIFKAEMPEIIETISAAKSPKKDGKGNIYVDLIGVHIPIKEAAMTAARKEFVKIFA